MCVASESTSDLLRVGRRAQAAGGLLMNVGSTKGRNGSVEIACELTRDERRAERERQGAGWRRDGCDLDGAAVDTCSQRHANLSTGKISRERRR